MSIYTNIYSSQFAPILEAVDAPGSTPSPVKATKEEQTAAQIVSPALRYANGIGVNLAYGGCVYGNQAFPGLASVPVLPGTYATYREMSSDPTLALGIAAANAPVKAAKWAWRCKPGEEKTKQLISDMLDPLRSHIVDEMLKSREFGWRGFEKIWSDDGHTLKRLKPLIPELTTIRYEQATGRFAGFRNTAWTSKPSTDGRGGVVLPVEKSLLYTHDIDGDDYYGRPLHENSRRAYSYWQFSTGNRFRMQRKLSGVIIQLHYPPGTNSINGVETDNSVIAQQILEQVGLTNSVALPNLWASENRAPAMAGGGDGKPQWLLDVLNAGETGEALNAIAEDSKYWDVLKIRGWLVPERAITEGQFGTKAEAETHGDILINVAEEEAGEIARCTNWHVVDQILADHNGEKARGSVWCEPQPLADEAKRTIKEIVMALIQSSPGFAFDLRHQMQWKAALEKLGPPLNPDVDIDKELADGIKEGLTALPPQPGPPPNGQPQPMNGNGRMNGDGGMKLSRSLNRLSRVLNWE